MADVLHAGVFSSLNEGKRGIQTLLPASGISEGDFVPV